MSIAVDQHPRRSRKPATRAKAAGERRAGWSETVELARAESLENRSCTRRVRHEAKDALGVVLFSAAASTLLSIVVAVALSWAA